MGNFCSIQFQCGDALTNRCWDCVAKRSAYLCQLRENLEDFQKAKDQLKTLKEDVMRRINNEEGPQMKRLEGVQEWLSNVEAVITEVDELIRDGPQEKEKLCIGSCCSKRCNSTYTFGKKISKRLKNVLDLKQSGFFDVVVERVPAAPLCVSQLKANLEALQTIKEELRALKEDVMRRVTLEEIQQKRRLEQVQVWLLMVEATITEVNLLIGDGPKEIEKLALGDFSNYTFIESVAKKLEDVIALKQKGDFKEVADRTLPEPAVERPSPETVGLETMLDEVWSCLLEEQVGIVGLYGMGGVGKTTLLTQINNKYLSTPHDFDVVIWIEVSRDLQLENVQDDIGARVGFSDELWRKKSFTEKATDICRILRAKTYVLLLDDLWERVDLTKVGVPLPTIENGSKLVFTTRSKDVCSYMGANRKIELGCLPWEKAWDLFHRIVGQQSLNIHQDIPELAKLVAKECKGLPLALITVGRAMAYKEAPQQWDHALTVLKNSASKFSGIEEIFYKLKFSYDYLPNDKARTCFLYYTLFPGDKRIFKTDLIDYWICEGFFDECINVSEAQNWGYEIIGTLSHACLLQEDDNYVKMHDMIRDMALWVAIDRENFFVETSAKRVEAPEARKWHEVRRMSLMTNLIENLVETPVCPYLSTLFLSQNHLKNISDGFFQFMPNLRVLDLSGNSDLTQLPFGISKLVSLEYLNLAWTGITQLPVELKYLVNLKYLNMDYTYELNTIPWSVISSLSMLHVLRMFEYGGVSNNSSLHQLTLGSWDRVMELKIPPGENEFLVEQLKQLKHLEKLNMTIKSYTALQRFLNSLKLQSCTHALSLQFLAGSNLIDISFLKNMKFLEVFWIIDCKSLEEMKIDWIRLGKEIMAPSSSMHMNRWSFNSICRVNIENCSALVDLTWIFLAPNLKFLNVVKCTKMEEIMSVRKLGELAEVVESLKVFGKLEFLKLRFLPRLKSIYTSALPFLHLKEMFLCVCPKLKKLPFKSDTSVGNKFVIQGEDHWWQALEWEDEATQQAILPCFKPLI